MHGVYVEWFLNLPSFFASFFSNICVILNTFIIIIIIIIIIVHLSTYF